MRYTTIYLGLDFGRRIQPAPPPEVLDELYLDYDGLLTYLEGFYGLRHNPANRRALRTEQYRQALEQHLAESHNERPFYAASLAADATATAEELLGRRDELLEAGYVLHGPVPPATPPRLRVLHALETILLRGGEEQTGLLPGLGDRLRLLTAALRCRNHPRLRIRVHEPARLLPPGVSRLLLAVEEAGDEVTHLPEPAPTGGGSDLARWQQRLRTLLADDSVATKPGHEEPLASDGSLVVLRAERETHLAAYLARMVRDNAEWRPGVVMTVRNQTLDNALLMEGLPSMGIPTTSLARPSLQVLKLVTAFLWDPIEVERIMEFVSLVTKPLDRVLGQRLAAYLADTPGLFGARWTFTIEETFRWMEARGYPEQRRRQARERYNFWFERRRHPRDGRVPKAEVRSLFVFLHNWARQAYEESNEQPGLLVLAAQAERATELLDVQALAELSYLDVERLVRTVYQPAPAQFVPAERACLPTSFAPAATAQLPGSGQPPLERLVWWDFVQSDPSYFFSRYYPEERAYLAVQGCPIVTPERQNALLSWQQLRPLLHCRRQLVLCVPHRVDGTHLQPHPLLGDLEAAFGAEGLAQVTIDIDAAGRPSGLLGQLELPGFANVPIAPLDEPQPLITIGRSDFLQPRERETPTAVEHLLHYPHQWVFRYHLKLRPTPILSIAGENRLRGNLGHLIVERLLTNIVERGEATLHQAEVDAWIDEHATGLLRQQGAVLLQYGQEPERIQFLRTMKRSAWTLLNYIQHNRWSIAGTEMEIQGTLPGLHPQHIEGRADLVLRRGTEMAVVDLKWRGKTVFREHLKNAGDIQLCLYAEFLRQQEDVSTVHTAYYVLRDSLMLARNELAFAGAETIDVGQDYTVVQQQTLQKICATHAWRWGQFGDGTVEVRCEATIPQLEDRYVDLDHDSLLELKGQASPFDDYRSLIGLIR